ncbi:MAG: polysaccharide deacetylase family protein [Pseudomonadota bacterium]
MKLRIVFFLVGVLLLVSVMACGTVQRVAVPITEALVPAGLFRLPAEEADKFVVLTIDDAPSSRTDELIALLARFDATATFFVHTSQINDRNRPHLNAARRAGHELGNHLPADVAAWKLDREEFEAAFIAAHDQLTAIGDGEGLYFRPPRAFFRPRLMDSALKEFGYARPLHELESDRRYIMASFIPWDAGGETTNTDDPAKNAARAKKYADQLSANLYPGAIVVFHDGEADGREARLAATMVSLEAFLIAAKAKGFDVISLSEGISRISPQE